MEKFTRITAVAAPLLRINIDTDAIVAAADAITAGRPIRLAAAGA